MNKLIWVALLGPAILAGCATPCGSQIYSSGWSLSSPSQVYDPPRYASSPCGGSPCSNQPRYYGGPVYSVPMNVVSSCGPMIGAVGPGCAYGNNNYYYPY